MDKFTEAKKFIEQMKKAIEIENPERLEVFSWEQLKVIYEGLLSGIDCIDYFLKHNDFSEYQMDEILDGMRFGIDYEYYAKESIDWKKMFIIKELMIEGATTSDLDFIDALNG